MRQKNKNYYLKELREKATEFFLENKMKEVKTQDLNFVNKFYKGIIC